MKSALRRQGTARLYRQIWRKRVQIKASRSFFALGPPSGLIQLSQYHATQDPLHNLELHLFILAQDQIQHYYSKRTPPPLSHYSYTNRLSILKANQSYETF